MHYYFCNSTKYRHLFPKAKQSLLSKHPLQFQHSVRIKCCVLCTFSLQTLFYLPIFVICMEQYHNLSSADPLLLTLHKCMWMFFPSTVTTLFRELLETIGNHCFLFWVDVMTLSLTRNKTSWATANCYFLFEKFEEIVIEQHTFRNLFHETWYLWGLRCLLRKVPELYDSTNSHGLNVCILLCRLKCNFCEPFGGSHWTSGHQKGS